MDLTINVHSIDGDQAFRFARTFLGYCGVWPDDNSSRPNLRQQVFSILSAFSIFAILLWALFDFAFSSTDELQNTISKLLIIFRFLTTLHKLFVFHSNKDNINKLFNICFSNFEYPKFLRHQIHEYQNNCYEKMKILRIIMTLCIFVIFPIWSLIPLMTILINVNNTTNILPIKLLLPFNFKVNTLFYAISYAFQILSLISMTSVVLGFKIFYITVAVQARRMLTHLCDVLQELHWPVRMTRGTFLLRPDRMNEEYQLRVAATLRYAVQHHQRTIKFIHGINKIYSNVLLVDFWTILLLLCVLAFQVTLKGVPLLRSTTLVQNFLLVLSFFIIICWHANDIMFKSACLVRARCHHAAWWTWSAGNQRTARLLARRCKAPLRLNVGPFYPLSLKTFTKLLSISFSYFMLLHQVQHSQVLKRSLED